MTNYQLFIIFKAIECMGLLKEKNTKSTVQKCTGERICHTAFEHMLNVCVFYKTPDDKDHLLVNMKQLFFLQTMSSKDAKGKLR